MIALVKSAWRSPSENRIAPYPEFGIEHRRAESLSELLCRFPKWTKVRTLRAQTKDLGDLDAKYLKAKDSSWGGRLFLEKMKTKNIRELLTIFLEIRGRFVFRIGTFFGQPLADSVREV